GRKSALLLGPSLGTLGLALLLAGTALGLALLLLAASTSLVGGLLLAAGLLGLGLQLLLDRLGVAVHVLLTGQFHEGVHDFVGDGAQDPRVPLHAVVPGEVQRFTELDVGPHTQLGEGAP